MSYAHTRRHHTQPHGPFHGVSRGIRGLAGRQLVVPRPLPDRSLLSRADLEVVADRAVAEDDIPVGFQLMRRLHAVLSERVREPQWRITGASWQERQQG